MSVLYDLAVDTLEGENTTLASYKGDVLLIVNTATECGFTPQLAGLESLYQQFLGQHFTVLGFPCNQFAGQEPRQGSDIGLFCSRNYGVTFPMFGKIDVNGKNAHPLFKHLSTEAKGILGSTAIKWNFTKFLVARDGRVLERFAPTVKPEDLVPAIRKALQQKI